MSFRYTGPGIERRTFESLSKPIMYLDAKQNELEDKIGLLEGEAAKYKKVALEEPNSKAAQYYNEFNKAVQQQADTLSNEGVFSNNIRNNVIKLNSVYNSNILPISQAYDQKMKMLEQQRIASLNNPNLRFSKNANELSIDDYMNNTANYKVLDLNQATQEGLQMGKILSAVNRGDSFEKVLGGQNYMWKKTLGYDMDELLKSGGSPEKIISDYFNKTKGVYDPELLGKYENDINQSFMKGVLLGTGKSTQTQLVGNKDYDYMLDIKKQNHAFALDRAKINYQYGLTNPPPPKTFSLAAGVDVSTGEENKQSSKNVKGETNALNNLNAYINHPKTLYNVTDKNIANRIVKMVNPKTLKVEEIKIGPMATGEQLAKAYLQSYKMNNVEELKRELSGRVKLGTHVATVGYELNSDYSKNIIDAVGRKVIKDGEFNLTNVKTGKTEDVSSNFKINDSGNLVPKVAVKFGFTPTNKVGYYIEIDGIKYKVDDSYLGTANEKGKYVGQSAIEAYDKILKNKKNYSDEELTQQMDDLNNLNIIAINNAATMTGIQAQTAVSHTK